MQTIEPVKQEITTRELLWDSVLFSYINVYTYHLQTAWLIAKNSNITDPNCYILCTKKQDKGHGKTEYIPALYQLSTNPLASTVVTEAPTISMIQ